MRELPAKKKTPAKAGKKALLVGLGLDQKDEHVRVTKGENFRLVGGSEETHEKMTETAIKFNEKLREKGKALEQIDGDEFSDLMHESLPK